LAKINWEKWGVISSIILGIIAIGITIYFSTEVGRLEERALNLQNQTFTAIDEIKKINQKAFEIENFPLEKSVIADQIVIDNRSYTLERLNTQISLSMFSPHLMKLAIEKVAFVDIDNSEQLWTIKPRIKLERPVIQFLSREITNMQFDVPMLITFVPKESVGFGKLGAIEFHIAITDMQSKETFSDVIKSDLILQGSILPAIIFNKEEYTPFDKVVVAMISPDNNKDTEKIERLLINATSSRDTLLNVSLLETGPNTGIFEGSFKLTPNKKQFLGDLQVIRDDAVSVEFRIDADTVASKLLFVNYHVGQVMFDRDSFSIDDKAVVRVIDPDANVNPDRADPLQVRIWSTTDGVGLIILLRETGSSTGIFEEIMTFTGSEKSMDKKLRVSLGDTLTAKYTDRTLPAPAPLDSDSVFTVKTDDLFATAVISFNVLP
jgi:hypothetical protein